STLVMTIQSEIVVTGGAGAIGSRLVKRLLDRDTERLFIVDDLSSGYDWLLPADERVQFVKGDVCGLFNFRLDIERPLVFHLAAFFANQNSVEHPRDDLHSNGLGTLTALQWAASRMARRFVYASAGCSIAGHDID